eukprot:CAMPEP_0172567652 /NCGR_PEP_ID=MMETSP1067-20121228/116671_1 /TAXON_ID=265564 ORGANISM="Thalassiosira punctigera, Strain Tpunct2005C2" /NCGR_SAMPLE_ID=MMETSP1067 /ASSEMBLY_ACC=CAM_ASM_000444 /LENGTH=112 /DNA_ID=CAMNT_0013359057 /DNA_START=172 /DNA_END=510 /DNA_ORIENTATION=-
MTIPGALSISLYSKNSIKRAHNDVIAGGKSMQRTLGTSAVFVGGPTRSPADETTTPLHDRHDKNCAPALRRRRVRFIDEVPGPAPRGIVTSNAFRPRTTAEAKASLYYTSQD